MSEVHKPGGIVKTSGIYKVVKEGDGATTFEVMWVGGEHFPLTRSGKGAHYELVHAATGLRLTGLTPLRIGLPQPLAVCEPSRR